MVTLAERTGADLRARLRAFVAHESESGRRQLQEIWARTVVERVESGECVAGLRATGQSGNGTLVFTCTDFTAKFREGDPLYLGDGVDVERGLPVTFLGFDVASGRIRLARDRFESGEHRALDPHVSYCLDRRGLGTERLLLEGLDSVFHPENAHCVRMLRGDLGLELDRHRYEGARAAGRELGLADSQCEALGRAVGTEGLCLIQGPPGTGKTRLLAEAAWILARKRCRVFVTGFTHRAVHNVLLALRARHPRLPIAKVGGGAQNQELARARIHCVRSLDRLELPPGGSVVGGTPYVGRRFTPERRFHFVLMDEAGQMPVVHGAIAMTQARRCVVVGDPRQLPPVRRGRRADPSLGGSIYEFLERFEPGWMLDRTFRMNDALTRYVSREFYGGRLRAAESVAARHLEIEPTGPLAAVLDPAVPLVLARIDHEGRTRRSSEEALLIVDLVRELRAGGLSPAEIAIIAPFRAQVRLVRYELERRGLFHDDLVVDTTERMQGQEREVLVLSLAASDRDYLEAQAEFFYEPGRLNVALTRARSKCIVVASRHAFRARPMELAELLDAARFKRLAREIPVVQLTDRYGGTSAPPSAGAGPRPALRPEWARLRQRRR